MAVTKKAAPKSRRGAAKVIATPAVASETVSKKITVWPVVWHAGGAILLVVGSLAYYQLTFAGRIYPGVAVGQVLLAGRSATEAEALLTAAWNNFTNRGLELKVGDRSVTLTNLVTSTADPDFTYELMRFNPATSAREAYAVGRQGNWLTRLVQPMWVSINGRQTSQLPIEIELTRVLQYIRDSLPGVEQPPQSAKLTVDLAQNIFIEREVGGVVIDASDLAAALGQRVANLSVAPVTVKLTAVTPVLNQTMVASLLPQAYGLLSDKTLSFNYGEDSWSAQPIVWQQWLGAVLDEATGQAKLALQPQPADDFFAMIEQAVNQPAQDAKFEIRDGRVAAFQGSRQGRTLDRIATLAVAFTELASDIPAPVPLVVATTEPVVTTVETNELGISEIIGVGRSNFRGSPQNRRHNIKVGAAALNGLLIKPAEEFSLLKALLPVDASTGYLPELVIKGNRTIPEYGGGLCQIGTTIFRAALASGLPITARRNHSYRVVYYEPAGTDATIYDPAPDFKFVNDTGSTILIQTRIEGDELIFEFWGRPDGRTTVQTKPRIFNITAPPETKIVETEDLPVGEKKCTEKPHAGADTEFAYTVTYPNGEVKEEVFKSHYVPWQEVCLVGVPKGTLTPAEGEVPPAGEASPEGGVPAGEAPVTLPSAENQEQAVATPA